MLDLETQTFISSKTIYLKETDIIGFSIVCCRAHLVFVTCFYKRKKKKSFEHLYFNLIVVEADLINIKEVSF